MKQKTKFKQTEIGMIPGDWKIEELGTLGNFRNGINFNRTDFEEGYPIINVKNLFRGRFATIDELDSVKEETIKNVDAFRLQQGDILFARSSVKHAGAGQVAMVNQLPNKNTLFSGFIIRFRIQDKNKLDNHFLNYLLRSSIYREYLTRIATGTTITNLSQENLSQIPIILPSPSEQFIIAKVLSDIDSKIELAQQMNKTLEAIGQAVFNNWFNVDDLPEGWEEKPLDKIAEFLNGLPLQKYPAVEGEEFLPVIKIRELRNGISEQTDKANLEIPDAYLIEDGDVLFSWSGTLEVEIWANGQGALNQHLFKVSSEDYPKWFYYYWTRYHLKRFRHIAKGKATTMGHIQRHNLSESNTIVPDKKSLEEMDKTMSPIIEKIIQLRLESRGLAEIRDSLLPRLMSGKIRVPVKVN
jgi:type I restriction enzyme S subunit